MTEFLSMTLLSAETVSAAKPQAAQSNDGATEPDQSFAATLAAEVNGKTPEKSAKALTKARQNNASDNVDTKEAAGQTVIEQDAKNDGAKSITAKDPSSADEEELLSADAEAAQAQTEKGEAEQSHWLNLLEKAKSLQERLTKTETDTGSAEVKDKQGSAADETKDKTKATELSAGTDIRSDKAKSTELKDGSVVLDEKLTAEQSSEQHLTAEELKALKLITQSDKAAVTKNQSADTSATKQTIAPQKTAEAELTTSEPASEKVVDKAQVAIQKDTGPDQNKTMAHIDKSLKAAVLTVQSAETEKQAEAETQVLVTTTVTKTPLQSEQTNTNLKAATAANQAETEDLTDTDTRATQQAVTDPKASVKAQSAAALTAPAAQQAKAPATEAKVSTEEALKQIQTAAIAAQGEQGASSSSGESSHQGSTAETILNVIEQQKSGNAVVAETNSFSNQLKSSLEKTGAVSSVASREAVSESSQKQVDQLGQKLNLIQPEASNQLKEKMLMMVKDKVHTAEIRLDPSELGSMQIKISLQQDQMSVQFMVQQGNAKELMEQQMPKLKELLQQQGIELSQGSVQQQNQSSSGQENGRRTAGGNGMGTALDASEEFIDPAILPAKNSDRVVDYYA